MLRLAILTTFRHFFFKIFLYGAVVDVHWNIWSLRYKNYDEMDLLYCIPSCKQEMAKLTETMLLEDEFDGFFLTPQHFYAEGSRCTWSIFELILAETAKLLM